MDALLQVLWTIWREVPSFFMNPFVYIVIILMFMQYNRQILFERKLLHVRINHPGEQLIRSLLQGLIGGLLATLLVMGLGIVLQPTDILMVSVMSLLLSFLNIQYLCFAYSGGIVGIMSLAAKAWPGGAALPWMEWLWAPLMNVSLPSLLAFVAALHLVEAFLVSANQGWGGSPLFLHGKRGLMVGSYQSQHFWILPFFGFVQTPMDAALFASPVEWWPLFFMGTGAGLNFMLFPAVIGHSSLSIATLPEEKAKISAKRLFVYSIILLACAFASEWSAWIGLASSVFAVLGHEGLIRFSHWLEWKRPAIFAQMGQGVVVLAVIPQSPADKLGVRPGDVILKVNGAQVLSAHDLYPALQLHSAFCKMEVRNTDGNIKYLQRAVYQGDHHLLGMILAPDEKTPYYVDMKPIHIVRLIRQQIEKGA